jgi:hypothetical protein
MRHAIFLDRIRQRLGHMLLPHKIRKRLRPPLPRNHLVSHKCLGAELLAVLAIRGFIFSARPAKVKTSLTVSPPATNWTFHNVK